MTTVIIALLILLLIAPSAVATYLAFAYLADLSPPVYVLFFWLAGAFTTATALRGTFWLVPSAEERPDLRSVSRPHRSSFQEKNHEKCQESEVRS